MKKKQWKSAAVLTLVDPGDMSLKGRKAIAEWLRQQAKDLVRIGDQYGKTLRARYLYEAR